MAYYVGIDLGGTNIKAGVVDETARILSKGSVPTHGDAGPEAVAKNMAEAARQVVQEAGLKIEQIDYVGMGAPGPVDYGAGVVRTAPNMKGWSNIALRGMMTKLLDRPCVLENDGNAASFAEFWAGAGKGAGVKHLIMLTLGTGVGSGLVVDGKIIRGSKGAAGEAGHMIVHPNGRQCGCGQRGCLETYASASRTGVRAAEAVKAGKPSSLKPALDQGKEITAKMVFDAAKAGDKTAQEIVDETIMYLAIGCVSLCRLFDPQMIVFAGGMILSGDQLFVPLREQFKKQSWKVVEDHVQIVPSTLGNDAGFIGAAAVAWDAHRNGKK